jgi:3-phosphoshikimate 1-carboxyvinyltransferase
VNVDGLGVRVSRSELTSIDITVPGDVSSSAFWLVAGCCHPQARVRVRDVGINPTRAGILTVLQAMGGRVTVENVREQASEPVADLVAETSDLHGTEIRSDMIPLLVDELPVLALAASLASGTTVISDAEELRVKESDRIAATVDGLSRLGANIEERPDGMVIEGGARLTGTEVSSYGDHRIAMTMAIAGLIAEGETVVGGAEAVGVSYPGFWETLDALSGPREARA